DRRPGADRVETRHEGEGLAGQVVARAGADEVELLPDEVEALAQLVDHGDQDLDLVAVGLAPQRGRLREADDGDLAHQMCSLYVSYAASGSAIGSNQRMLPIDVVHSDFGRQSAFTRMPMWTSSSLALRTCMRTVSAPSSSTCTAMYGSSSGMFSDGTRTIA